MHHNLEDELVGQSNIELVHPSHQDIQELRDAIEVVMSSMEEGFKIFDTKVMEICEQVSDMKARLKEVEEWVFKADDAEEKTSKGDEDLAGDGVKAGRGEEKTGGEGEKKDTNTDSKMETGSDLRAVMVVVSKLEDTVGEIDKEEKEEKEEEKEKEKEEEEEEEEEEEKKKEEQKEKEEDNEKEEPPPAKGGWTRKKLSRYTGEETLKQYGRKNTKRAKKS